MAHIQPVILCGGSGSRLWPLSRSGFPKQFLCLTGDDSLFQQAAKRLSVNWEQQGDEVSAPLIICHEDHRFLAQEQLREAGIGLGAALLEPVGRNTAPALTLAALQAIELGLDPILVVTPADQTVTTLKHLPWPCSKPSKVQRRVASSFWAYNPTAQKPATAISSISARCEEVRTRQSNTARPSICRKAQW
jgi:mannose-1-phosphate guanylyltransferase